MKQRTAQPAMHTDKAQIDAGNEGPEAVRQNQLSDAELEQISGGGLLSSPLGTKLRRPTTQWSGTPYQPEEDVEAY